MFPEMSLLASHIRQGLLAAVLGKSLGDPPGNNQPREKTRRVGSGGRGVS